MLDYKLLFSFVLNATLKLDGQDLGPRNIKLLRALSILYGSMTENIYE